MNNIVNLDEYRDIIELIRGKYGNKFCISYIDNEECFVYLSDELTAMERVFISDTISKS